MNGRAKSHRGPRRADRPGRIGQDGPGLEAPQPSGPVRRSHWTIWSIWSTATRRAAAHLSWRDEAARRTCQGRAPRPRAPLPRLWRRAAALSPAVGATWPADAMTRLVGKIAAAGDTVEVAPVILDGHVRRTNRPPLVDSHEAPRRQTVYTVKTAPQPAWCAQAPGISARSGTAAHRKDHHPAGGFPALCTEVAGRQPICAPKSRADRRSGECSRCSACPCRPASSHPASGRARLPRFRRPVPGSGRWARCSTR